MSKQDLPKESKLRPHIYDGIQEYDNRLPNWWLWTFYGAVIFSVLYWFSWYNADMMMSDSMVIEAQMAEVEAARLSAIGEVSNDSLWQMSRNPGFVTAGQKVYSDKCVACHGPELRGGIGLNLVDNEWKWGNQPLSVFAVVTNGSPDKLAGMQSWSGELGMQKISQVVAFVLSRHTEQEMAEADTMNEPVGL